MHTLELKDLHVSIDDQPILQGVTLSINEGELHAMMGPNGSGKSTLANVIMGHPSYVITKGTILVDGEGIAELDPEERAKKGLFLSFQYPASIPGVTLANMLRLAVQEKQGKELSLVEYNTFLKEKMKALHIDPSFARRYVNEGFSGGEKKRAEILQLLMLEPTFAILDETDSGLDVDALKTVAEGIMTFMNPTRAALLITHYYRILEHVKPTHVHILYKGKIIKSGDASLAKDIETNGYHLHIGEQDIDLKK